MTVFFIASLQWIAGWQFLSTVSNSLRVLFLPRFIFFPGLVHIDQSGFVTITDRSKDVIKSGGEWISSIDLENEAMGHPGVQEAAVIGVSHPKWTERPLLVVVLKPGQKLTESELLTWLSARVAKWWVPEAVEFVDSLPHTATGKVKKVDIRKAYQGYKWRNQSQAQPPAVKSKL